MYVANTYEYDKTKVIFPLLILLNVSIPIQCSYKNILKMEDDGC